MGEESTARGDRELPEGIEVREGARGSTIRVTFRWEGQRRREPLKIPATASNIRYAERLRAEVINAIERGKLDLAKYAEYFPSSKLAKLQARAKKRYLFNDLVENYINDARNAGVQSPSSIDTWVKWARARIKPKFIERYVDDIDTPELRTWISELSKELAPKSVRNIVGLVSVVLTLAATDKLITTNPLDHIKLKTLIPRRLTEDDDVDPFNAAEIAAILAACDRPEERWLFQYAFSSGLRTGELIAVKWPRVDWARGQVRVIDNVVSGENGTVEKTTKTGVIRDVPFIGGAEEALRAMMPISKLKQAGGYVFLNREGTRWRNNQQIRDRWEIILRRAKVRYRNPYQTRHTFASTLLMNGEPELLVAHLLGHVSVEMVRRTYGKYIRQADGKVAFRGDYSSQLGAAPNQPQTLKGAG